MPSENFRANTIAAARWLGLALPFYALSTLSIQAFSTRMHMKADALLRGLLQPMPLQWLRRRTYWISSYCQPKRIS